MSLSTNFSWTISTSDTPQPELSSVVRLNPPDSDALPSFHLIADRTSLGHEKEFEINLRYPQQVFVLKRISAISSSAVIRVSLDGGPSRTVSGSMMPFEDLEEDGLPSSSAASLPVIFEIEHLETTTASASFENLKLTFPAGEDLKLFVLDIDTAPFIQPSVSTVPKPAGKGPDPAFLLPLLAGLKAKEEKGNAEEALIQKMAAAFERVVDTKLSAFESRMERKFEKLESLLTELLDSQRGTGSRTMDLSGQVADEDRPSWLPPGVSRSTRSSQPDAYRYDPLDYHPYDARDPISRMPGTKDRDVAEMNELVFL